mmetsp:Transcript_18050/g.63407  ORF Transcript_18050/g.63407 Transcript_18050/m.63407 type:complete len:827 (+) Transcript_18050:555-3035(+)
MLGAQVRGRDRFRRQRARDRRAWRGGHGDCRSSHRHGIASPRGTLRHRGLVVHVNICLVLLLLLLLLLQSLGLGSRRQNCSGGLDLDVLLRRLHRLGVAEKGRPGTALHLEVLGDLELLREADRRVRRQHEGEHVDQGEPIPHLREQAEADGRTRAQHPGVREEGCRGVSATRIHDTIGEDGAEPCHHVLVLVADGLQELLPEGLDSLRLAGRGLHVEQAHGDDRSLTHEVSAVGHQGLQQVVGVELRGARASDAEGHGSSVAHVRVVALGQQLHDAWQRIGRIAHDEAQAHDRRAPHIVLHVGDGDVQQALDGRILGGSHVGEGDGPAGAVADDGVLVQNHLLDQGLGFLLTPEHRHRQRERATADDLLVLRVVCVRDELADDLLGGRAHHDKADAVGGRLTCHGGVRVQGLLQLLIDGLVGCGHAHQPEAQACAMRQDLRRLCVVQLLQQIVLGLEVEVVRVDDAHRIQGTAFGVRAAPGAATGGEVGAQDGPALLDVSLVDDPKGSRGAELGPIRGLCKPLQVLAQEDVTGCAALHEPMGDHSAVVRDRVLAVDRILDGLQEQEVRAVVPVQELQMQVDGSSSAQDLAELCQVFLLFVRHGICLSGVHLHGVGRRRESLATFCSGRLLQLQLRSGQENVAEMLVLVVHDVEGDLVCQEPALLLWAPDQVLEDLDHFLGLIQDVVALGERGVIDVLGGGVDLNEGPQHPLTERLRGDQRHCGALGVLEHARGVVAGHDELFDHVQPPCLDGHSKTLLECLVLHTTLEHPIHHILELVIHGLRRLALQLALEVARPHLDELVDGHRDDLLDVLRAVREVEELTGS